MNPKGLAESALTLIICIGICVLIGWVAYLVEKLERWWNERNDLL